MSDVLETHELLIELFAKASAHCESGCAKSLAEYEVAEDKINYWLQAMDLIKSTWSKGLFRRKYKLRPTRAFAKAVVKIINEMIEDG